jgi:AcrR family transcriptional regulator
MDETNEVKQSASYSSPLRARQAAETRRSVIDAALTLFSARGWTGTTLPMVAKQAGVAEDTIYKTFGSKSALLMEVVEVALVGDDGETAMMARADFTQVGAGRRPERLRAGVRYAIAAYERSVGILDTLCQAAANDDVARARLARYQSDRHDLIAAGTALILGHEPTREVVDAVWTLLSPEVYTHLIIGQGWSEAQAEDWLVDMMQVALKQPRR